MLLLYIKKMSFKGVKLFNSQYNEAVLARTKMAFRVTNDKQLADKINIVPSGIIEARKRNSLPFKKLITAIVATNGEISLDWVFGNTNINRCNK
jgi:hypothetical protein